jgi:hypothetical protein
MLATENGAGAIRMAQTKLRPTVLNLGGNRLWYDPSPDGVISNAE